MGELVSHVEVHGQILVRLQAEKTQTAELQAGNIPASFEQVEQKTIKQLNFVPPSLGSGLPRHTEVLET